MLSGYYDLFTGIVKFYSTSYAGNQEGNSLLLDSVATVGDGLQPESPVAHLLGTPASKRLQAGEPAAPALGTSLQLIDLLVVAVVFINLLLAKKMLVKKLHDSKFLKKLGLRPKDHDRLDECVWRMVYYIFSSTLLVHSCVIKHQFFDFFRSHKDTPMPSGPADLDEYIICMIEIAFYLHATYALVFEDVWRRDSPMMLIHHVCAVATLIDLYTQGVLRLGLVMVILRDTVDILLELAKVGMCLRIQHGKPVDSINKPVKYVFAVFAIGFTVNQLYYYPVYCVQHFLNIISAYRLQSFNITCLISYLLVFLTLDLLWFTLICKLLYKMLTTSEPLEDTREYDEQQTELPITSGSNAYKIKSN